MFQLKFTADFKDTYLDIPYWQVIEDIPKIIQDWIKEDTHEIIIHNQKTLKYYCPNCLNELEEDKSCSVCHLNYASNTDCLEIYANELKDIVLNKAYYVFDIVNNHPYLYEIKEKITYNNNLTLMPFKMAKLTITKAFLVEKNGLRDLINQEFISFNFLASYHKTFNEESDPFLNNNSKKDYELYEQIV